MGFGIGGGGTSTAGSTKEGFQWSIVVLVSASEEENKKKAQTSAEVKK